MGCLMIDRGTVGRKVPLSGPASRPFHRALRSGETPVDRRSTYGAFWSENPSLPQVPLLTPRAALVEVLL